jgi:cytoskeletal protein RodZ
MTVGNELRQAREAAGLSADQLSERTKIQLYKIEALENGDFEKLPQGIYLDGIVRAYAHEVALDPEPMVERARVQRGKLPGDWEVPFSAPIDLHGPASHKDTVPFDDIPLLDLPVVEDPLGSFETEKQVAAAPIPQHTAPPAHEPNVYLPPRTARRTSADRGLVLPVLVLLAALGVGFYFYQLGQRRIEPVPYSENAITPDDRRDPSSADRSASLQDTPSISDTPAALPPAAQPPQTTTLPPQRPAPEVSERPAAVPPPVAAPRARPERIETPGTPDVTGSWRLATHVESSSLARFEGLKLGYEVQLEQEGDRVRGSGRKISENGEGIGARAQTPVTVNGTIDGDRLTLNFVERGTRRPTQGKFVLLVDDSGTLRGRFSSNAARSSGRVEAHRVTTQ